MKTKKIIQYLDGGFGNQLFQIVHLNSKRKETNELFYNKTFLAYRKIPFGKIIDSLVDEYNISIHEDSLSIFKFYIYRILYKLRVKSIFNCYSDLYAGAYEGKNNYLFSYFQNVDFSFVQQNNPFKVIHFEENKTLIDMCSVHIRGGDYLTKKSKKIYCNLGNEYYQQAINKMIKVNNQKKFKVFTNDLPHAKKIVNSLFFHDQVEIEYSNNKSSYDDFVEMSQCKYSIISNSTFSFWSAISIDKTCIAPNVWYKRKDFPTFISKEWILNKN